MKHETYKFGDQFILLFDISNFRRPKKKTDTNVLVPAGALVSLVSATEDMAIIKYKGDCFSTRLSNIQKKEDGIPNP